MPGGGGLDERCGADVGARDDGGRLGILERTGVLGTPLRQMLDSSSMEWGKAERM